MIATRLLIALPPLVLLAACGKNAPADDSRSASGEVLEGTVSDAMLPLDRLKSEPPFEDPKAAREAQEAAAPALGVERACDQLERRARRVAREAAAIRQFFLCGRAAQKIGEQAGASCGERHRIEAARDGQVRIEGHRRGL